jgi:phage terminase small subunit
MLITIDNRTIELSDGQVSAFHALTRLQQGVALGVLEGLSQREAYRRAGGKAKTENAMDRSASQIVSNRMVDAFVKSFRSELIESSAAKLASSVMSREEMLERLSSIARTKIDDVISLHNNPLIDEETGEVVAQAGWAFKDTSDMTGAGTALISELTAGKDGLKIKTHSQIAAMKQIAELQGYNKPQQVEVTGAVATNVTPQQVLDFKKAFNESF